MPNASLNKIIDDSNAVVYALNVGDSKQDVFNYTIIDNNSSNPTSSTNILTISLHDALPISVAVADTKSGNEGNETVPSVPITGNVLANDTDVDSPSSAFSVTNRAHDLTPDTC